MSHLAFNVDSKFFSCEILTTRSDSTTFFRFKHPCNTWRSTWFIRKIFFLYMHIQLSATTKVV